MIGQVKTQNLIFREIKGSLALKQMPKSMLFYGEAGLGKSYMIDYVCQIMTARWNANIHQFYGSTISDKVVRTTLDKIARSQKPAVIVIDEIHAVKLQVAEIFYPVMLENKYSSRVGMRTVNVTILGATTNPELLAKPLKDRFWYKFQLKRYKATELKTIIQDKFRCTHEASLLIASRSRGVPRYALQYAEMAYKTGFIDGHVMIDVPAAKDVFNLLDVDEWGLKQEDRDYILLLADKYGEPMGRNNIALSLGIPLRQIEENIEPYLLRKRIITRTSRGRVLNHDNKIVQKIIE